MDGRELGVANEGGSDQELEANAGTLTALSRAAILSARESTELAAAEELVAVTATTTGVAALVLTVLVGLTDIVR